MDTKISSYDFKGPGAFTIQTNNGELKSSPTQYTFDNDISHGNITNSVNRNQHLQKVEHIKMDNNLTVDGTSQTMCGGVWHDVGNPRLHSGQAQKAAAAINKELYALLCSYPDRNTGEPSYHVPDIKDALKRAEKKVTDDEGAIIMPSITKLSDVTKWISAYSEHIEQKLTLDRKKQIQVAAKMCQEEFEEQKERQKQFLIEKYGEEMYNTLFKAKVEAGAVYNDPLNTHYATTKEDLYEAAITDGKAERRNAFAAKIG